MINHQSKTIKRLAELMILSNLVGCFISPLALAQQRCNPTVNRPNTRYEIVSSGAAVKDLVTGLIWQRCSVGQQFVSPNECRGQASLINQVDASGLGDGQWRLPTKEELESLVDSSCYPIAINLAMFPNPALYKYITKTHYQQNYDYVWSVSFNYLNLGWFGQREPAHARLVKSN